MSIRPVVERRRRKIEPRFGRVALPWWMHPRCMVLLLGVPFLIFAYLIPQRSFVDLYGSAKHVDLSFVLVGLLVYGGFLAGSFLTVRLHEDNREGDVIAYCRWFVWPMFLVTVFGYAVWFGNTVLAAGGLWPVLGALSDVLIQQGPGASDYVKFDLFQNVPGITTLTQVGILYATVEALLWTRSASDRRIAFARFSIVLLLGLTRAVLLSERLALIETVVPVAIVWLGSSGMRQAYRKVVLFLPFIVAPVVFGLFAFGEYFRSWTYYRSIYPGTYLEFAIQRFLGYYTTAVNNAAVMYYFEPLHPFRHTLDSLFAFPLFGEVASRGYTALFGGNYTDEQNQEVLRLYANPEFNNVPIIGLLPNEFTILLAPVVALLIGAVSVSLYKSFASGYLVGLLLYPSWFVGLLEISRVYYWSSSRYFPVLAVLFGSLLLFKAAKVPVRRPHVVGRESESRGEVCVTKNTR